MPLKRGNSVGIRVNAKIRAKSGSSESLFETVESILCYIKFALYSILKFKCQRLKISCDSCRQSFKTQAFTQVICSSIFSPPFV